MRVWRFGLAAMAMLTLAGCDIITGAHSYRYRVTVEVDTPAGPRSASSVWQVNVKEGSGIPDRSLRTQVRGEAVAVDLPGGTVFALMRGYNLDVDYPAGLVNGHLRRHAQSGLSMTRDWAENIRRIAEAKPTFDLYPEEYPLLVRFRDANDPASVERLEPNALADAFGDGVRLRKISVAVTRDTPELHIYDRLPWLKMHRGALQQPPPETPIDQHPIVSRLNDGDFSRG